MNLLKHLQILSFLFQSILSLKISSSKSTRINLIINKNYHEEKLRLFEEKLSYSKGFDSLIEKQSYTSPLFRRKSFYNALIKVGNPPQELLTAFDTGSAYSWFASGYCHENKHCLGVPYYDHSMSKTYRASNNKIDIEYGSAKVHGILCHDDIYLGNNIRIRNVGIGEVIRLDNNFFRDGYSSGLIGISYPSLSIYNHTLLDYIKKQGVLSRNIIAFNFEKDGGHVTFGKVDLSAFKGKLNYHKLVETVYWTINLTKIKVAELDLKICEKKGCLGMIDTGSSTISFPTTGLSKITKYLKVNKNCSNVSKLPTITFEFDHIPYRLDPHDYVYKHKPNKSSHKKKKCYLDINSLDIASKKNEFYYIFGEPLIRKYYCIFDRDKDRVGLALKSKV